ncbi:hypothetical protein KJ652_04890 [Patescibacteria group bacterium]|nr:hypothetical protein [Patescibacteria group bacterium]
MQKKTIQYLSISFFVLLVIWGLYTLFYYLGVPFHGLVLLERPIFDSLQSVCGNEEFYCRGIRSFWPFIEKSFIRSAPLLWYGIISVFIYAMVVGFNALKSGNTKIRWTFKPWHLVLLFLASVWLIFTVLSAYSPNENSPSRRLVEPLPQVYQNVGEEGLATLRDNMDDLQERGCLIQEGTFDSGARSFLIKRSCIQKSFFTRVFPLFALILIFLFELLVAGRAVLGWIRLKSERPIMEAMLSVGLGACAFIAMLWTMAVISFHFPSLPLYTAPAGWTLFVLVPLIGFKHSKHWLNKSIKTEWKVELSWRDPVILLTWLLISYLAFNFLSVVRPFPIGWDDLGSYLNRPRLMVSYGHFIFSMAPFFWEYLTSVGFLLFGYSSSFGVSAAMMINWSAGLLAVLSVFTFTNVFLGKGRGILAALLYYTLPMVGHFSFADMKIDNAVFAIGSLSVLCVFAYLFPMHDEEQDDHPKRSISLIIAAGILGGFAFAIKPTTIMVLIPLGAILVGVTLNWTALFGVLPIAFAIFTWRGLNLQHMLRRLMNNEELVVSSKVVTLICSVIGIAILAFIVNRHKDRFRSAFRATSVFAVTFLLAVLPWIAHNNILNGNTIPRLALKAPNNVSPVVYIYETAEEESDRIVRGLPEELLVDREHPLCSPTGGTEELDRYWGFDKGAKHYLTLPWRTVMNINSTGYYVTTNPVLLLIPLILLLPFFWMRRARWVRWLLFGTALMVVEWMFMGNGIIWYGLGTFFGMVVLLEVLVAKSPDVFSRYLLGILIGISLIITIALRFWQYETQKNLLEYPMGKSSAEVMIERTVPHYNDVADIVVDRYKNIPDRPYLYRVGTFIPYFIPKNLEIIGMVDHQLDFFNCIYQERDPMLTVHRLKALGFNSIVFDTNTATIERDPNGSLHQKVNTFLDFVNNPETGLNIVLSDTKGGIAYILIP